LPAREQVYFEPDVRGPSGHGVRVYPSGERSFYLVKRDAYRKQRWVSLGATKDMKIEAARDKAREVIARLDAGQEPFPPPAPKPVKPDSVEDVVRNWLARHVEKNKLRTAGELRRQCLVYILPRVGQRPFADLRRSDIAKLLDTIEDTHGAWIADSVLGILRSVATFFASRNDDYVLPFTRKMRRVPSDDRERKRILTHDELRKVWVAAEQNGPFGAFIRLSLLLAQRREKLATMRFADIAADGIWRIPTAPREKGNPGSLKMPPAALAIVNAQPRFLSNPHVFPGRGKGPVKGFTALKAAFDKRSGVTGYSLHDLRRTARSLMAEAGIDPLVAEKVLGHRVGTRVQQIYDRHDYSNAKADALVKLAAHIEGIVHPPPRLVRRTAS
jgi:integrase